MIQKIHFIAIGGSVMHNLALALHQYGHQISGSDDEIFEPSKTRLSEKGLLPENIGWFPQKITKDLDAVILGMHARIDNPELIKAQELGLKIYSYPEYIYESSKQKQRIVIAGSHGKTTITSMILHVLRLCGKKFDYVVGAKLDGFDLTVQISDAPIIIIEGDEYLASPLARIPKFLQYHHHIGVISGIAWDHINVFPIFEDYRMQFELFVKNTPKSGTLIYNEDDKLVSKLMAEKRADIHYFPYSEHKNTIKDGVTYLDTDEGKIEIKVFGEHNLMNINAAKKVCRQLGINEKRFSAAISTFTGAANRLQILYQGNNTTVFKDFAHAPSKLKATTDAVKKQFKKRKLIACLELHTFSSLNKEFIGQYKNAFDQADVPIVYFDPHTVAHKKLPEITKTDIMNAFNNKKLLVFDQKEALENYLKSLSFKDSNLLLMSSGIFGGLDVNGLIEKIKQI